MNNFNALHDIKISMKANNIKNRRKIVLIFTVTILLVFSLTIENTTIVKLRRGHIHFSNKYIGDVLTMEDGQKFTIFRRIKVETKGDNPENLAVFKVRFKFKNFGIWVNKKLSFIPVPFLIGMEGFREKDWTINEDTNEFQGIYQWSSREIAEQYPETFIFRLMTKRAVPGTVSYEIIPKTDLSKYISNLLDNPPSNFE